MAYVGRPSKYDPKYCEMLIEHMSKGYSFESFGAVIGSNRDTLYEWAKRHSEFSDAKKHANDRCLEFWEKQGIEGLYSYEDGPKLNSSVWIFNMKHRHRWRDRHEEEEKKEGIDLGKLPLRELMALAKQLLPELTAPKAEEMLIDDTEQY